MGGGGVLKVCAFIKLDRIFLIMVIMQKHYFVSTNIVS